MRTRPVRDMIITTHLVVAACGRCEERAELLVPDNEQRFGRQARLVELKEKVQVLQHQKEEMGLSEKLKSGIP